METQFIQLNMTPTGVNPCFHVSQYDVGRPLGFIVHSGGMTVDLDIYTCTVEATRSDGTAITSAVATTDNIGTFETTATMTNKADKYKAQFVIVDGNSKRIASLPFDMEVTKAAMDENAESIEEDASLYQQYTEAVQGAIAEANANIQAEENARIAAVSAEENARIAAVNAEATTRANADATLQNNIDAEATARTNAITAEATARQTADNTLQGNINSEASARASADSNLQSQINQIIAPSGEAPSAAEVQNARIGADGVTYDTLGNAIRGQVSDLKNHINELTENVISSGGMFPSSYFAQGSINSSGNYIQSTTYRVSTPETFTVKNDMIITADDGFILTLWLYPFGGTAYNQDGGGFVIPKWTNARVMVRRVNENTSESANVEEFSSALFLTINDFDAKAINKLSYDVICERFEHITYVDLLKNKPTLDKRTSAGVFIDYDVLFHENPYSIHMKILSRDSVTSSEIRFTMPTAITLAGTQEFEMCVFIDDATNISGLSLRTLTGGFVKSNYPSEIKNGWNKFRFFTEGAGSLIYDVDVTTFRLIVTHVVNTDVNLYIGSLIQIKPDRGNLIMVDDGPYKTYYDIAYPALKAINCPVTWALDPGLLGDNTDPNRQNISQEEVDILAYDGSSEFSFHNYDGTIMSTATEEGALSDTLNCIRYLRKNGLEPKRIFRAAWLQNNCPNHALADLEVDASATYNGMAGITMYPFPDRYNIARFSMQGRTTAAIDTIFDKLKNQHCTVFMYTHGISDDSDKNLTNALLQYYVEKISTGISEGWLNTTTYNRLMSHYRAL